MSETIDRSYEAQLGVIGSLLLDAPRVAGEVFRRCRPEHFTGAFRTLFEIAKKLQENGSPVDPITVKAAAGDSYAQTILQIMDLTPTPYNCGAYIEALLDLRQLEAVRLAGTEMAGAVNAEDAKNALEAAAKAMVRQESARVLSAWDSLLSLADSMNEPEDYIGWGIPRLDREVLSAHGDFVVLGGRPSSGKTALALQFAWHQAQARKVGFFSLETSPEKLAARLAAMAGPIDFGRINRRTMQGEDLISLARVGNESAKRHLDFIHAAGLSVAEIAAITAGKRYEVIFIDYLQLVRADGGHRGDLFQQVTQVSMALHTLAQTRGVMIVALSQLSRPDESLASKAPTMASLRQSGQIEQDADAVLLLYLAKANEPHGKRRLSIAKNKTGPSGGYFDMDFDGARQRFTEITGAVPPGAKADEDGFVELGDWEPVPF